MNSIATVLFGSLVSARLRRTTVCWCVVTLFLLGATVAPASATIYTLQDGNSRIDMDTDAQATFSNYYVEGVDQLKELSNFYRVGTSGAEKSVHTLSKTSTASDSNGDGLTDTVDVTYDGPTLLSLFAITIRYKLDGGAVGSGYSSMGENVIITNGNPFSALTISFFEYVDLDLSNTPSDDITNWIGTNLLEQSDPFTVATASASATHYELATYSTTLTKLTNGSATTLSDTPVAPAAMGPGDVTWGLQFNLVVPKAPTLGSFTSVDFRKDFFLLRTLVPEPSSYALALMAVTSLLVTSYRRRRRAA